MKRTCSWLLVLALGVLLPLHARSAPEEKPKVITEGSTVSIEYTLSLDDGTTADSNLGEEPLVYRQGGDQILPALEHALAGMGVDERKEVTITPEDGYGPVDPSLVQEVDAELIPEEARKPGAQLVSEDPAGDHRIVRVQEVRGDRILLDFNHPLAGKTLHFKVRVVSID
jgi:FKBP-type peptidyl-prolyl cis-trans isomerase SlyD